MIEVAFPFDRTSSPTHQDRDILLRELNHRCSNDLQLVVSMLGLQARCARTEEARTALAEAGDRVAVLARARSALQRSDGQTLEGALSQVCAALRSQAELRGVLICLSVEGFAMPLAESRITVLALAVNELVTNALKHAFAERMEGRIAVCAKMREGQLVITVDDDGLPFPPANDGAFRRTGGLGLNLVARLLSSIDALIIGPSDSKSFEIRLSETVAG